MYVCLTRHRGGASGTPRWCRSSSRVQGGEANICWCLWQPLCSLMQCRVPAPTTAGQLRQWHHWHSRVLTQQRATVALPRTCMHAHTYVISTTGSACHCHWQHCCGTAGHRHAVPPRHFTALPVTAHSLHYTLPAGDSEATGTLALAGAGVDTAPGCVAPPVALAVPVPA